MNKKKLFSQPLAVINIGADLFADFLRKQGVKTVQVTWRPPAGGDKELAKILERIK